MKAQVLTGGRGKAGGVKLADGPDEAERARRRHPRARHPRPRRPAALDRALVGDRARVLPLGRARPGRRTRAADVHDARAASRSSRSPPRTRTRSCASTSIRSRGSSRTTSASCSPRSSDESERDADRGDRREALPLLRRVGRDALRDQPADRHARRASSARSTRRSRSTTRRSSATPSSAELRDTEAADPLEAFARERGVIYVKLDGSVGILGNGAGLSMATVDVVVVAGGRPANFCDLGGGGIGRRRRRRARGDRARRQVRSILFNIFGGITRCDEVARGILEALDTVGLAVPIVVRLDGTNAEEGRRILAEAGSRTSTSSRRCSPPRRARWSWPHERRASPGAPAPSSTARAPHTVRAPTSSWWSSGRRGCTTAIDVATGGGHVARRLREAGLQVVSCDPAPGMRPT